MRYILHPVAYTIWLLALGISVALAWQFHGGDNTVALAIALLALGLSAFGVIFARDALQRHDWFAALCGIVLWAAGAVFFTITEIGYWDSSYNRHYTEYQQVKTAKARADGLNDKRWNALTTGDIPATPAQIKAQIAIATVNERWTSTKGCADVTTAPSREFCTAYFKLQSQLAVAEERVAMEQQFAREIAEKEGHIVQNLLAGAEVLARRLDITDRQAADLVIFAAWALLFLARDLGGVVANPLGRRKPQVAGADVQKNIGQTGGIATETSDKPVTEMITPEVQEPYASKEELQKLHDLVAEMKAAETEEARAAIAMAPEFKIASADLPATEAETNVTPLDRAADDFETVIETASNVTKLFSDDMPKPLVAEHPFSADIKIRREKTTRGTGSAINWADECTEFDEDADIETTIVDIWPSYSAWCRLNHYHPMAKKELSRKIGAHLKIPPGRKNGKRTGSGKVFRGLIVHMPQAERRYA